MDPYHSAHDVHRCDLCETTIVHSYCDFCHVNLCKPCVAEHISDHDYEKHKIVPFQLRETTLIYPKCELHPHKSCDLQCNDCSIFVCTSCAGSKQHKGHDIWKLDDIYKTKKDNKEIKYKSKTREFRKPTPTQVKVSLPTFIPKLIDREKLYSLFGKITSITTAIEQNVLPPQNLPNTSVKKLLDEPNLDVKIQILHSMLSNVAYVDDEQIWTSGETGEIKCFNIKGLLLFTVWTKSGEFPNDIAVDGNGNLLFSDWSTKSIYTSKNWQTEELITLDEWTPCQLCVTSTGDLLVTMYSDDASQSKVVRYSGSTEKNTIQFDEEGKPLYSGNSISKYISENRNHDICVADYGAGAVVVVNQDGNLRWRYTGHPFSTRNKQFYPCGITADSESRILTADGENHCIHILDQNGQFLRYIDNCDLNDPWGLSVDKNDNLFVCEYEIGNLKKIKYCK